MQKGARDLIEISAEHSKGIKDLKIQISNHFEPFVEDEDEDEIQGTKIAVIGRPNAGKSTFINQFTKQKRFS